jgi:hypothetical protein
MLQVFVVAVFLFGLYGSASAVDNHWLGTAGDNKWGNAANWELGHVPDAVLWPTEEAEIGYTTVGAGPILGLGDVGSAYRIFLGQNDGDTMYGEITIDGGTLTTIGYMSAAYHEGTSALITMNSGSVYIGDPAGANGHLYLGRAASAILNINGGTFVIDDNLQLGRLATGYGEVNLAGGTLQASNLTLGEGTGLIDITGGTMVLNGGDTAVIDAFITSGLIVGYGGTGTLNVAYENDLTTVTAVPKYSPVVPTSFALAGEHITATASSANTADEGPEKTIDGSGLDANDMHSIDPADMWVSGVVAAGESAWIQYEFDEAYALYQMLVWNHNTMVEHLVGFGIKEAIIKYSLDASAWVNLGDTHEFHQAPCNAGYASDTTIDFGGVVAKYVRLTPISNWGGVLNQYGLSEVRFMYIPMRAREPQPASGATDVQPQLTLSWNPGGRAALHNVYLSTNEQTVIDGTAPVTTVTEAAYGPLALGLGKTYYWRVDEVNEAEVPAVWEGDIWSFSTKKHYVVDDFESYTDYEGNRIYETWLDGFTNNTGSVVGHTNAPFAEQTIVHSGSQSMPLQYNNASSPWYSQAERTWVTPQDWTVYGADTLRLYVRSDPNSAPAPLYIALKDNGGFVKAVTHPDGEAAVGIDRWREWSIPLSEFSNAGVNLAQVKTLYIGVGNRDNPTAGGAGRIYIDDIILGPSISPAGYALEFDGIDDYVETPISDVPVNGTVEAWVKTVSNAREAVISSHGGTQEFRLHLNYQPGKAGSSPGVLGLNVRFRTLTAYTDIGSEMYDGSWHHVVFVWEGASPGTIRSYWDGQEKPVTYRDHNAWEGNYNRTVVHVIGRECLTNNLYYFAGTIDDVRFWDKTRSDSEIQEYMNRELTGNEEGLRGYWKFNEAEGTTAYDSSPNNNDGTIVGAAWTTDAAPVVP